MIEYSARAVRGLAYLFKQYNDVEVYVEDQTCKGMYEVLLGRILGEDAKISRVFQLKGKQNVIDACKADQTDTKRRRIYIIDGDFDSVVGNNIEPDLNYFYQLKVYCSENLLISQNAIEEIAFESLTNSSKAEAALLIECGAYFGEIEKMIDLFALYLVAYKLKSKALQNQTTGYNVNRLLESDKIKLSIAKLKEKEEEVRGDLLSEFSEPKIEKEFLKAKKNIEKAPLKFISGKSYLVPLLHNHLVSKANFSGHVNQLKTRLARYCKINVDNELVLAVRRESRRKV